MPHEQGSELPVSTLHEERRVPCSQEKYGHFHSALEVQAEHRMFHPTFTSPSRPSTTTHITHCARFVPSMRGLINKLSLEEAAAGAAWPGDEAPISNIQIKFPPFNTQSVHLSVNLPRIKGHFCQNHEKYCGRNDAPSEALSESMMKGIASENDAFSFCLVSQGSRKTVHRCLEKICGRATERQTTINELLMGLQANHEKFI